MNPTENTATLDIDKLLKELGTTGILTKQNHFKIITAIQNATLTSGMNNIFKPTNMHYKMEEIKLATQTINKTHREIIIQEISKQNKKTINQIGKITLTTALLLSIGFIAATHI